MITFTGTAANLHTGDRIVGHVESDRITSRLNDYDAWIGVSDVRTDGDQVKYTADYGHGRIVRDTATNRQIRIERRDGVACNSDCECEANGRLFSKYMRHNGAWRTFSVELPKLGCDAGKTVVAIDGVRYDAYPTRGEAYGVLRAWSVIF